MEQFTLSILLLVKLVKHLLVVLVVLQLAVGYNATVTSQTDAALNGIHTIATLVPAVIFFVLFFILIFLYPLNKKRQN